MQTRRHPRTLQEAFGPYTSNQIQEDLPFDWQDYVVMAASGVALAALVLIVWFV